MKHSFNDIKNRLFFYKFKNFYKYDLEANKS